MKLKLKILLFFLFLSSFSFAQVTYEGVILDAYSNQPILGANIKIEHSNKGTTTDQSGVFEIELSEKSTTLIITHISYQTETKIVDVTSNKKGIIYLIPRTNVLNEITVIPKEQIESMSDVEKYSISDFKIFDDQIFRLEYHGVFKKHVLSVTDLQGKLKASIKLGNLKRVEGLHKSCNNLIYVLSSSHAHLVAKENEELLLVSKISRDTFNQFIKPCHLRKGNKLYYINKKYNGLMSDITTYDMESNDLSMVRSIANEEQMKHYWKDVYLIEHSQEITNIYTNSYAENQRIRAIQEDGDFLMTVFYKPEYPVYISAYGERVVVWNHIEQKIETYQQDTLASELLVDYVLAKNWLKAVTIDPVTEKAYGLFDYKKGVGLQEINIDTGTTDLVAILETAISDYQHISVFDGVVYYLKEEVGNEGIKELLRYGM